MTPGDLLPGWPEALAVAAGALLWAGGLAAWVGRLRTRRGLRTAYTRKIFHFGIFTGAGLVHLVVGLAGTNVYGATVAALVLWGVWRSDGHPFYEALARPSDEPRRTLFILVPLATTALGGLGAALWTGPLAAVGYLVGGWGDAVGEPVGAAWGRHPYRVPSMGGVPAERTLEGSAAVLVVGIAAGTAALLGLGHPLRTAVLAGAAAGAVGALVEAVSTHGADNLTVQLGASGTAWWLLNDVLPPG